MKAHGLESLRAGDTWEIRGRALNNDGSPLDISNATIEWVLVSSAGPKLISQDQVVVTISDGPAGLFVITVPHELTSVLPAGNHKDVCRVTTATYRDTIWTGPIRVHRNDFG